MVKMEFMTENTRLKSTNLVTDDGSAATPDLIHCYFFEELALVPEIIQCFTKQ